MDLSAGSVVHSPRLLERRRAVRAARRRVRRRIAVGVIAIGVVAYGAVAMSRSAMFDIESIEVSGARAVASADVLSASGLRRGDNILAIDEAAVAAHVRASLPAVRDVRVERVGSLGVRLVVLERRAVLVVRSPAGATFLDEDGSVLPDPLRAPSGLPEIRATGLVDLAPQGAADIVRIWKALPATVRRKVDAFLPPGVKGFRFLIGDAVVLFGDATKIERKIAALVAVMRAVKADRSELRRVDLRAPERPAVRIA